MILTIRSYHPDSTYPFAVIIEDHCDWNTLRSMKEWIVNHNISSSFISTSKPSFWFKSEKDATMFMLRWS